MAIKHYLFVNEKGKKFKTTLVGKKQMQNNKKLSKLVQLLGECDEKGRLISEIQEPVTAAVAIVEAVKQVVQEQKYQEVEQQLTKEKRKYVKKEK